MRVCLVSVGKRLFVLAKEERRLDQFLFPGEDVDRLMLDEKIVRVHSAVIRMRKITVRPLIFPVHVSRHSTIGQLRQRHVS